jgi:hypothetical protein
LLNNSAEELGKEIVRLQQVEVERMREMGQQAVRVKRLEEAKGEMERELEGLRRVNRELRERETQVRSESLL